MKPKEILDRLNTILDQHTQGIRGSMVQNGSKDDIFSLFAIAYENGFLETSSRPRLNGDGIREYFFENFIRGDNDFDRTKREYLISLTNMWAEWYYACNRLVLRLH